MKTFQVKIQNIYKYLQDKRYRVESPTGDLVSLKKSPSIRFNNLQFLVYDSTPEETFEICQYDLIDDWTITDLLYVEREKKSLGYFVDNPDKCFLCIKNGWYLKYKDGMWEAFMQKTCGDLGWVNLEKYSPIRELYEVFTVEEVESFTRFSPSSIDHKSFEWFKNKSEYCFRYNTDYYCYDNNLLMKFNQQTKLWEESEDHIKDKFVFKPCIK